MVCVVCDVCVVSSRGTKAESVGKARIVFFVFYRARRNKRQYTKEIKMRMIVGTVGEIRAGGRLK